MANGSMGSFPAAASPRSRLWLSLSLLFVFLRTIPSICYPIARDQSTFCYIGQRLLEGKHLYLDLWDNKPPGIFFVYALIVKVFGSAMWSVGVVDILWLLLISYFIFRFTERFLGTPAAVIAVVFHTTWRVWMGYWDAAQPENFLVLLVLAAYFLSSYQGRRRWLCDAASGLLFGAAFWLKYNAVAFVPLLLLLPYLDFAPLRAASRLPRFTISRREWIARVGVWAAVFAVSVAGVLLYFAWVGAWPAMKEVQFEVLPRYNAMAVARAHSYWSHIYFSARFLLGPSTLIAALVSIIVARRTKTLDQTLPVFLATAMGTLCLAMQTRLPSYAFETCYPFFAMLWGYLGVKVFQGFRFVARWCSGRGWRIAAIMVWLVFANVIYLPLPNEVVQLKLYVNDLREWHENRDSFYANYPWARPISHYAGQMRVIQYLGEHSTPAEGVFIWGSEPLIYFLSKRNPPTRFVSNLGLMSLWTPPTWRQELLRDLDASPPRYIIVERADQVPMISFHFLDSEEYLQQRFPSLLRFVTDHYQKVADFQAFAIYRHD
jgi:hypothetical protein